MNSIQDLKVVLREDDVPFFSDEELQFYLKENNNDYKATAYRCLLIKAEDTTLSISGMSAVNSSKYFRRLASMYKPHNSRILGGSF